MASHLFSRFHTKGSEEREIHPVRDWKILCVFFCILVLVAGYFSFTLFSSISHGELVFVSAGDTLQADTIDQTSLHRTVTLYEEKAKQLKYLELNKQAFVDPS